MNGDFAAAWVYSRDGVSAAGDKTPSPVSGKLTLIGLKPGKYHATWWDTETGKSGDASDVTVGKDKSGLTLTTPAIVPRRRAVYHAGGNLAGENRQSSPSERNGSEKCRSIRRPDCALRL